MFLLYLISIQYILTYSIDVFIILLPYLHTNTVIRIYVIFALLSDDFYYIYYRFIKYLSSLLLTSIVQIFIDVIFFLGLEVYDASTRRFRW